MPPSRRFFEFLRTRSRMLLGAAAVLLAAVEVGIDFDTWIQLNVSIVYSLPLVLAAAARNRRLIWLLVLMLLAATFAVYAIQISPGAFSLREPFFVNRIMSSATLLISASLLHGLTVAVDALDARGREAEEASSRKTRLLASVSHDIRTPLTTINIVAGLIRQTATDPVLAARVPDLLRTLQANALSVSDMVSDVLDISAIDSGRATVHQSEFPLDELLAQEFRTLEPLARAKGLRLSVDAPGLSVRVRTDRLKLARIVRNLVTNAINFTDAGGVTVACVLTPDNAMQIGVSDTGIGIAPENLDRIFGEFAQLRAASGGAKRGWGLGLAICRRLAGMLGARITVQSTPNLGSTFTLHLPPASVVGPAAGILDYVQP